MDTLGLLHDEFMMVKRIEGLSQKTLDLYNWVFDLFLRECSLTEDSAAGAADERAVLHWILSMKERELAVASINNRVRAIRTFLYYCMDKNYISRFNISLLRGQEEKLKFYTDDELKVLLRKPRKEADFYEMRTWLFCVFVMATGARAGTCIEIKYEDIDLKTREVTYTHLKNKKTARIPLTPVVVRAIAEQMNPKASDYLFHEQDGSKMSVNGLWHALRKYCGRRGVKCRGQHALRHSFARSAILMGIGPFQLQRILTHSSLDTTKRYVNLFSEDLRESINEFSPLNRFM